MPRALDLDQRRADIVSAAMDLLARGGTHTLTINGLAEALGGSTTLVTHIFRRKEDIYEAVFERVKQEVAESVVPVGDGSDVSSLRAFIEWCIPTEPGDLDWERMRFAFLERSDHDPRMQALSDLIDDRLRDILTERLEPLAPASEIPGLVDLIRAVTNGAILSVVEHPQVWSAERQLAVIDQILTATSLVGGSSGKPAS